MDKHYLEFWGNLFLAAARGQQQVEDAARWMNRGMSGYGELTEMFRRFYGLESGAGAPADSKQTDSARTAFEDAHRAYLDMLGVVPKSDHAALQKRFDDLKQRVLEQEETIRTLRLQLSESRMGQGDVVRGFQELMQVQSERFQELTGSFSRFFPGSQTGHVSKKEPE